MSNHEGIGERIRSARVRSGLSREELAVRADLSWSAIAQIEAGRRTNLRPGTLAACAEVLGVTADYLLGRAAGKSLLEHQLLVYDSDEEFVATAAPFLEDGVEHGEPALAVTTKRNIEMLRDALGRAAKRVRFAHCDDWYSEPSAALIAYRKFAADAAANGATWSRVLGEPVWCDRSDGDVKAWARYESLINLAFAAMPMTLVCPYDKQSLDPEIVERGCATHEHRLGPDGLEANPQFVDPGEFILRG